MANTPIIIPTLTVKTVVGNILTIFTSYWSLITGSGTLGGGGASVGTSVGIGTVSPSPLASVGVVAHAEIASSNKTINEVEVIGGELVIITSKNMSASLSEDGDLILRGELTDQYYIDNNGDLIIFEDIP